MVSALLKESVNVSINGKEWTALIKTALSAVQKEEFALKVNASVLLVSRENSVN